MDGKSDGHKTNGMSAIALPVPGSDLTMRAGQDDSGGEETVVAAPISPLEELAEAPTFERIYDDYFDFVWRSARRLGVHFDALDDVVQEVFLVVYRRLDDFEGRSSVKTWVFGITLRVARTHRRGLARKGGLEPLPPEVVDTSGRGPEADAARAEGLQILDRLLGELDDDKRAVFVLAELEQMTAPEIADALGTKVNTVYSRLRAAKKAFEAALRREKAREERQR